MSPRGHTDGNPVNDRCQPAHAALRRGVRPSEDPALAGHLAGCPACATLAGGPALVGALDAAAPATAPVGAWLAEAEAMLARERGPRAWLHSRTTAQRTGLAAAGAGLVPLLVWLAWRRIDAGVYPTGRLLLDVGVVLLPAAWLLVAAMRPLHRPAWPRAVAWLGLGLAVAGVLAGAWLEPAHHAHPASLAGTGPQLVPRALACLAFGTGLGLPALLWLVALARGGERPSLLAVVAGLAGGVAIFLHCPIVAPEHLVLGHAPVMLVVLALMTAWGLATGLATRRRARGPR